MNLKVKEDRLESRVKGVTMKTTPSIWMAVVGLKCEGLKIGKGNIEALVDYNKITFYKSCMRDQCGIIRGFNVGGSAMNLRIIAFIIVWIMTPRGHVHTVLHEKDIVLMYCIVNRLRVNEAFVLEEQMQKSKQLVDYKIPYVVLVSNFIEYFCVPLEGEIVELVKQNHEVLATTLHKIGLTKINNE